MVQQRQVENIIPNISEMKYCFVGFYLIMIYKGELTNAENDAGHDDEVETVAGEEVDSLGEATLEW